MNSNLPFPISSRLNQLNSWSVFFILFFLGLSIYFNAIFYPFVHDELVFILKNPSINDLNLRNIFLKPSINQSDLAVVNTYYRPLLELLNRLLFKMFQFNPWGYHLVNIFVHILNSFLVYQIAQVLAEKRKALFLMAAVLFLVHPIQSEAVACISGISNLLFAFFCLGSFFLYLKSCHQNRLGLYAISLFLFFICLFAKEQAVILPFLLLLYEICFNIHLKGSWIKSIQRILGFFLVLAGYFLIRTAIIGFPVTQMTEDPELWLRLRSIPASLLMYLGLIFFPSDLHYYRSVDMLEAFIVPTISLMVVLFTAGFLTFLAKPYRRLMIFGAGWFLLAQAPTLNIIPIVNEYSFLLAAEHFMYFPLIGILFWVTGLGLYLFSLVEQENRERVKAWGGIICACLSLIFTLLTIKQNTYWRSDIALFERTVQFEKKFGRGHLLLAQAYAANKEWGKALMEYNRALAIMQGYLKKVKNEKIKPFYQNYINQIYAEMDYSYKRLKGSPDAP